jgi:Rrf2 family protein
VENLNSKTQYALLAALVLTSEYDPKQTVKTRDIADRTGAPRKYLGQILRQLKNRALLKSEKGPTGGYRLMRPPGRISVAEVIAAVSAEEDGRRRRDLPASNYRPALRWLGSELDAVQRRFLAGITLQDFLEHAEAEEGESNEEWRMRNGE